MAKSAHSKKSEDSLGATLWHAVTALVGGVKPMVHQLQIDIEKQADHYTRIIEKRLTALLVRGTALLVTILFIGFGFVFVLIDYIHLSRAVAFLCCGLLGMAVLVVAHHWVK